MTMAKDAPSFHMIIENGRLAPATPYDQERLNSFLNGLKVRVRFVGDHESPWIKRWWAVLNLAVKQCKTPWKTADQASDYMKHALGHVSVNIYRNASGAVERRIEVPRSLTELADDELKEMVELMEAVLQRITGVDPATLRKEAKVED
jgi:hypothetical protein